MKFNLDCSPGPKPVLGVDDLLLGLTHHWARDQSIFPTEDDRLDVPTIMLFQAYTACRPAELVDGTKSKGKKDPLLDDPDDGDSDIVMRDSGSDAKPHNRASAIQPKTGIECKGSNVEGSGSWSSTLEDSIFDDSDENGSENTDHSDDDTDYSDDDTDYSDDDINCDDNINHGQAKSPELLSPQKCPGAEAGIDDEQVPRCKALCYEDIVLWIVQDPNKGERDLLAMEVYLRHHKGADNKPKPYDPPLLLPLTFFR